MAIITLGGSASIGSGYSFGDLIEKVYRRVMSGVSELTVSLAAPLDALTYTNIQLTGTQVQALVPGAILSVDLELMLVLSVNVSTNTINVQRGYMGSIATAHLGPNTTMGTPGAIVYINSALSRFDIGIAINDDLSSLSAQGLVRINTAEVTYNPIFMGYDLGDLPTNFVEILEIRYKHPMPDRRYPPITRWKVSRGQDTSIFPSGNSLTIYEPGFPGMPMYITYSAPLIPYALVTDNICNTPSTNDLDPPYNGYPASSSFSVAGSTLGGSNIITVSSATNIAVGMFVSDSLGAVEVGSVVMLVSGTSVTLSSPAAATHASSADTFTFSYSEAVANLPVTAMDIPPLGAIIQLVEVREFARNSFTTQPDPRKAVDVPAGSIINSVARLEIQRKIRVEEEVARIRKQYTRHAQR